MTGQIRPWARGLLQETGDVNPVLKNLFDSNIQGKKKLKEIEEKVSTLAMHGRQVISCVSYSLSLSLSLSFYIYIDIYIST